MRSPTASTVCILTLKYCVEAGLFEDSDSSSKYFPTGYKGGRHWVVNGVLRCAGIARAGRRKIIKYKVRQTKVQHCEHTTEKKKQNIYDICIYRYVST